MTSTIIPRDQHPISRKMIDEEALKVLYRLHRNGFLAYLVGGSVRDLLLGKVPKDFDVATNAHPHEINALFKNSRIIGRRFRLVHVFFRGEKSSNYLLFGAVRSLKKQRQKAVSSYERKALEPRKRMPCAATSPLTAFFTISLIFPL